MQGPRHSIDVGDRAQNFVLPDSAGKFRMFYERTRGRPVVLLFTPGRNHPAATAALQAFIRRAGEFDDLGLDVFCVSLDPVENNAALEAPFLIWSDPQRAITGAYLNQSGIPFDPQRPPKDQVTAYLLDSNQRILALRSGGEEIAAWALEHYGGRPRVGEPEERATTAPVLIVPNLIGPKVCRDLIRMWSDEGHEEGTVGSVIRGAEGDRLYDKVKRRLDHRITDPAISSSLQQTIGRRVAPEVHKAFNYEGFRFDRLLVVCYDARRGDRFRPHRDNLSPSTADRRFAMTLNLNTEEYEGGGLVFPEYGADRYRPESGGAVIFSCSLIHEALPVTRGRRFALLTFLRDLPNRESSTR